MFYVNVGYQWGVLDQIDVPGAIFRASGQDLETALRRPARVPPDSLFDPQLYLVGLDIDTEPSEYCPLLVRLSTYGWFGMSVPEYDSTEGTVTKWRKGILEDILPIWSARTDPKANWEFTVGTAVRFQLQLGCSRVILPAPLISDPETSLDEEFYLLDAAASVARSMTGLPLLASIPLDERAVQNRDPKVSPLLDALVDGVSSRGEELAGVYVAVVGNALDRRCITSQKVAGAVLRIAQMLGGDMGMTVIVNYADALGLAACAVGAAGYGTGYSTKDRRMSLHDLKEVSGGRSYPKFLSLDLGVDLYPKRDMEGRLRGARLLRKVRGDATQASEELLQALEAGLPADSDPAWEERSNNTAAARLHFIQRHMAAAEAIRAPERALEWLQDAEAAWTYLNERFKSDPLEAADGSHLGPWRRALEGVLGIANAGS